MAALLTSVLDGGKVAGYIGECERLHIKVLPPSVNESRSGFTVAGEHIRFGLLAVKNLGRGMIAELVKEREENGLFRSFYDFCRRMSVRREFNRRALDSLIRCGALDGLAASRRQMLEAANLVMDGLEDANRRNLEGQLGFFDDPDAGGASEPPLPNAPEFSYAELLAMEKEVTGLYLSGHPLAPYAAAHQAIGADRIDRILESFEEESGEYRDGMAVTLLGMVSAVQTKTTKTGAAMAYVTLEDLYGSIEMLVFPKTLSQFGPMLQGGSVITVAGRLNAREDEAPKLLCDHVAPAPDPAAPPPRQPAHKATPAPGPGSRTRVPSPAKAPSPRHGLYLRLPSAQDPLFRRTQLLLDIFTGSEPLYIRFADTGKMVRATQGMGVWPHPILLGELRRLLGEENVAVVS